MGLKQYWAVLFWMLMGSVVLCGYSAAATPTPAQLQMLQKMSDEDLSRLQKLVKDKPINATAAMVREKSLTRPIVLERDPYATDKKKTPVKLLPFGYDLFAGVPTTFAPAGNIPVMLDYVMGVDDVIEVQLFGSTNVSYSLRVDRRGMIVFPSIGEITVAGMSFDDLRKLLKQRVAQQFIGVETSITLGELRSIRIFVLGDVQRPGSYVVSSFSTMTNALFVSGGVTLIGSLRNIQLKRNGKRVAQLDFYDLLLQGNTQHDQRIQPGDVIFVPPIGKTVAIEGKIRRPAIYELRNEKKLSQLIHLAGGLLPDAYPDEVRLERVSSGRQRELIDVNLQDGSGENIQLRSGDVVHVYSVLEKLENTVILSGHVKRPLAYQWYKGMRLTDVVPSVDLLQVDADVHYVLIQRRGRDSQYRSLLSTSLDAALADVGGEADSLLNPDDKIIVFSLESGLEQDQSKDVKEKANQRVGIDLYSSQNPGQNRILKKNRNQDLSSNQNQNLLSHRQKILLPLLDSLRELATVEHPARIVSVGGHVRFPGSYPLDGSMRISDLIRAGGYLRESAYTLTAELTRRKFDEGQMQSIEHIAIDLAALLAGQQLADQLLQPYDYLSIREIPQWREQGYMEMRGEVRFPGRYPIRQGETLADLIDRAGGLTAHAFVAGAVFAREKLRQREREQFIRMADNLDRELAGVGLQQAQVNPGQEQAYQFSRQLVQRLRNTEPVGRLVLDLKKVLAGTGKEGALNVVDGDALFIPPQDDEVTVVGEVFFPTSHVYQQRQSRNAYIGHSGGLTANADDKRIYIVRASGVVDSGGNGFWSRQPKIRAGDTIVVPLDADRIDPIRLWTNVTQILYQLALTTASLKTLGVF